MSEPEERKIHLLDYWRILVKRRWLVYTSIIVLVATVALGSLLEEPIFTATTRLQIERNAPNILPFQELISSAPDLRNDFYQTQFGLIQSRRVAREVIKSLELDRHQEFQVGSPKAGGGELTPDRFMEGKRIDLFLKQLKVAPVRNSRLVDISFASRERELAARVANRVAETYIAFNSEAKYNTSERATASLSYQVANLQEEIDRKEKELQKYASEHGIIALGEKQNISLKNLNDQNDAYVKSRVERIEQEARYSALLKTLPENLSEVRKSKLIQDLGGKLAELKRRKAQLSEKYKGDWPEMVRLEREVRETREQLISERRTIYQQIVGGAESAFQAAQNQEEYLKRALGDQKREFQEISLKEIRYNNLKADIANRRTTLEALVKRQSETASAIGLNDLAASNVRIVDSAEIPSKPSSPKIALNILLSFLSSLLLGVGLAFFFEYLDKSVKSPEEMQDATGVSCLGMVPFLGSNGVRLRIVKGNGPDVENASKVELISHENSKSKISEAFREIRTALLLSRPGGPPRTFLIASAQPGEGKTTVALNLAITLTQIGRRVLLVETDLRKPRLHKLLGISNQGGLSNWLGGFGSPEVEAIRTPIPGLDLVPSGPLPPNPADLLDSERLSQIQREFQAEGYDHIIYDSPPVLAVADPAILAGHVDAVVMVVLAGVTGRDVLGHAVKKLNQVNAPIIGAILNQVDFSQQGYYGYSYKGYYPEEETEKQLSTQAVQLRTSSADLPEIS